MGLFSSTLFPAGGESGDGGGVIQVKQNTKTSKFATTSQAYTDVTGFDCTITPTSSSNKILVITSANFGAGQDGQNNYARILRGISGSFANILSVNQSIRMPNPYHVNTFVTIVLDTPNTTSAVLYKYQCHAESNEVFLNRGGSNVHRGQSTIILMEISS